jgi:hypothetical protein
MFNSSVQINKVLESLKLKSLSNNLRGFFVAELGLVTNLLIFDLDYMISFK